jgi:hypothetical protein
MQVTGNATMTLTPPTSGNTAGITIFQDRNAPAPTTDSATSSPTNANQIGGNGAIKITGVIYFPNQGLTYNGNASTDVPYCTQIVALTLTFHGNSKVQNDCFGTGANAAVAGVNQIGAIPAKLTE